MKVKKKSKRNADIWRWAIKALMLSFCISIALTLLATHMLDGAGLVVALLVLLFFIALGVAFDMFGIATATASEKPFHSMAARRVEGASESLHFIRQADKVSSFCNDIVGDICGIVSGTSSAVIVTLLVRDLTVATTVTTLVVSGILAGLTVGGKALGKPIAMQNNTRIVLFMGRLIYVYKRLRQKISRKA